MQNQAEEQITYQLCHMYSRADKSVGYATPAYMADHACHWDARVFFCVDQLLLILLLKPRYGPFKSFKMQQDLLKALFYISVFRGVDIKDGPTIENLQIQVLKMEAHPSPMCCLAKKKTPLGKIEK